MLAIKLRPVGKKKQISYRIVINEKRSKLDGKCIEDIGWYNPHTNKFSIKKDRADHWLSVGAQPTDSVHNILVRAKAVDGTKIAVHKKSKHPETVVAPETKAAEIVSETSHEETASEPAVSAE